MHKIAVIATSTGCLDYLNLKNDNLRIIRMKLIINEDVYSDYIEMTAEKFYTMLDNDSTLVPSSSMPSIGEFLTMLEYPQYSHNRVI